jgi:uncharacterized protein YndB with AHSA1/START domain
MTTRTIAPVQKSVTVNAPQERAFDHFTRNFSDWWPVEGHTISEGAKGAAIEPREGGRWYEYGDSGDCVWGHVIAYEPPARLLLAWQLDHTWQYDPDFVTEVEVRFVAASETTTRVELEHRDMEKFAPGVRESFDSEGGWGGLLVAYAEALGG